MSTIAITDSNQFSRKVALCLAAVAVLGGIVFSLFSELDIIVTSQFYDKELWFFLFDHDFSRLTYKSVFYLNFVLIAGLLGLLGRSLWTKTPLFGLTQKSLLFLFLAFVLGPGLVVNLVFKENWGRARPHAIQEFGGNSTFSPALVPADQCDINCSFVAGHPSTAFYLIAFAFLLTGLPRLVMVVTALGLGLAIGMGRLLQGAHFLSDVLFSGVITIACVWLVHKLIIEKDLLTKLAARLSPIKFWTVLSSLCVLVLFAVSYIYWDREVAVFISQNPWVDNDFTRFLTEFGHSTRPLVAFGVSSILLWGLYYRRKSDRFYGWAINISYLFAATAASGIVSNLMKFFFGRLRPIHLIESGTYSFEFLQYKASMISFPSGHSATVMGMMTALYMLRALPAVGALAFGLLVVSSRVMLNEHYVGDVMVGAFLGVLIPIWLAHEIDRRGIATLPRHKYLRNKVNNERGLNV